MVTERAHDVVSPGGKTNVDGNTTVSQNPGLDRSRLGKTDTFTTVLPDVVDDAKGTNGVGDVVGAVGERGKRAGEHLQEGVELFGLGFESDGSLVQVGVLVSIVVSNFLAILPQKQTLVRVCEDGADRRLLWNAYLTP